MKPRTMRRRDIVGTAPFLTFCCFHNLPLLRSERLRDLFVDRLARVANEMSIKVLAWVVMRNHVQLIVHPESPDVTMTRFTHALKRPFALTVLNRWRALNAGIVARLAHRDSHRFWQTDGGFDRNVMDRELLEKIRYIHCNPVRRGLVETPAEYRWSSAAAYEGRERIGPGVDFSLVPESLGEVT